MKRYVPVIVLLMLLAAGCWAAGCTSTSGSSPKTRTTTNPGPVMTTPVRPVFTTPVIGSAADASAMPGKILLNTSTGGSADACPASRPTRCADGYCAAAGEECSRHAQVVNCSSGEVRCP